MIDFSAVKEVEIYAVMATKIERDGVVLWEAQTNKSVTLQVEKIRSSTYAGETTYTGEQFILLNIYPKTNGTVSVTYGGLTKTITDTSGAAEPNAQQVFFGTFNGVSDTVTTPASGGLTIEGDCRGVGCGSYNISDKTTMRCSCITAVVDLNGNEIIPNYAFEDCSSLTSVDIPEGVISIGIRAFEGCLSLTNVFIPASVTTIGMDAFERNAKNAVTIQSGNAMYKTDGNCLIETASNTVLYGFIDTVIPSYVTTIGESAFKSCSGLTSIIIPESVTTIGESAFEFCSGLTSAILSEGLTNVKNYTFRSCSSLTSITIPASITEIGGQVFVGCSNLKEIRFLSTTPPKISSNSLYRSNPTDGSDDKPTLIVPNGCADVYKAANVWKTYYADYIVEAS